MCVHALVHACRFAIVCTGVCALGVAQKHGNALLNRVCSGPSKISVSHGRAREWLREDTARKGGKRGGACGPQVSQCHFWGLPHSVMSLSLSPASVVYSRF